MQLNCYQYAAFIEETARQQSMGNDLRGYGALSLSLSRQGSFNSMACGAMNNSSSSSAEKLQGCWGSQTYVTPAWWSLLVSMLH